MQGRTILKFPLPDNFWPEVEAWAAQTGFTLDSKEDARRLYRKGHWLLMAPAFVELRQEGRQAILEAWVKADSFLILSMLTGQKAETGIASGGLIAALPRSRAREAVNRLLARFGQTPLE